MKTHWPKTSLAELLRLERRPVEVLSDHQYQEIDIYCFGRGVFHKTPRTGLEVGDKDLFLLRKGDFILQVTFAWEGAIAIISADEDGMYASTRYPTFRVDENRCEPRFLLQYFKTKDGLQQLIKICPGSAGRNRVLSIKRLSEVLVPLPPLAEQCRVVAQIDKLADQVSETRILRDQASSETRALRASTIASVFATAGEPMLLNDIKFCEIICGQHLSPEEQADSGIPYMTGPADFGTRTAVPSRFTRSARALAKPGDVLLTVKGAGVGKVNLAPQVPAAIGRQLYSLRPNSNNLDQLFLYYALQYGLQHFRKSMTATTVPGIGRREVEQLPIPIPPLSKQKQIAAYLDDVEQTTNLVRSMQAETSAEIEALLPSILDKAFRGEL